MCFFRKQIYTARSVMSQWRQRQRRRILQSLLLLIVYEKDVLKVFVEYHTQFESSMKNVVLSISKIDANFHILQLDAKSITSSFESVYSPRPGCVYYVSTNVNVLNALATLVFISTPGMKGDVIPASARQLNRVALQLTSPSEVRRSKRS